MKLPVIALLAFLALLGSLFAQAADPVLMTLNGNPVKRAEFEYFY